MKIIKEIISKDCFDDTFIKEYTINQIVTTEWIEYLENFGKMTCLKSLKNPFYSFEKKHFFTIKGILNENKLKVIFNRNNMDYTVDFFNELIENFNPTDINIERVKQAEKNILNKLNNNL